MNGRLSSDCIRLGTLAQYMQSRGDQHYSEKVLCGYIISSKVGLLSSDLWNHPPLQYIGPFGNGACVAPGGLIATLLPTSSNSVVAS